MSLQRGVSQLLTATALIETHGNLNRGEVSAHWPSFARPAML